MAAKKKSTATAGTPAAATSSRRQKSPRKSMQVKAEVVDVKVEEASSPPKNKRPIKEEKATPPPQKRRETQGTPQEKAPSPKSPAKRKAKAEDSDGDFNPGPSTPKKARSSASANKSPTTPKSANKKPGGSSGAQASPSKLELSRREQDRKYIGRVWLFKTEIYEWYKYDLGCSDLLALPSYVKKNEHRSGDCHCYRVWHLDWLQAQIKAGQIKAGNGLNLPAESVIDEERPQFVQEHGDALCRKEILEVEYKGLRARQLKRIKPCKKVRPPDGKVAVEHWNVADIEALVRQGRNLKKVCPPAPEIRRPQYRSSMVWDYDSMMEVVEARPCPCCEWLGLDG